VLSADVFTCRASRIKDVAPMLTMVAGDIVFDRKILGVRL
jgi:predicted amidohydrolase YtcJ